MVSFVEQVPSGDRWHRADIGTNGSSAGFRQLEFVVTNGQGEWDKPPSGVYLCTILSVFLGTVAFLRRDYDWVFVR